VQRGVLGPAEPIEVSKGLLELPASVERGPIPAQRVQDLELRVGKSVRVLQQRPAGVLDPPGAICLGEPLTFSNRRRAHLPSPDGAFFSRLLVGVHLHLLEGLEAARRAALLARDLGRLPRRRRPRHAR
jgi:hypothetical protein